MISYSNCIIGSATVIAYVMLLIAYRRFRRQASSSGVVNDQKDIKVTTLVVVIAFCSILFYVLPNMLLFYLVEVAKVMDNSSIGGYNDK